MKEAIKRNPMPDGVQLSIRHKLLKAESNFTDMLFYGSGIKTEDLKKDMVRDMMQAIGQQLADTHGDQIRAQWDTEYERRRTKMMLAGEQNIPEYGMHPPGVSKMRAEFYLLTHEDMVNLLIDIAGMNKVGLQKLIASVFQDSKQYNLYFDKVFLTNEEIK